MKKEKIRFFAIILILITICFMLSSSQTVSADGGIFVDFGEHVYLPSQKAAIFWDGVNETMVISTKINTSGLSNMAWVTPVPSYTTPQISQGDKEIFNEIAYSFAEDSHGSLYYGNQIFFILFISFLIGIILLVCLFFFKRFRLSYFLIILFLLIICASFSFLIYIYSGGIMAGSSYEDVELAEMKTVDFYDVAVLKATNATSLVNWLEENDFIVTEDSIPVLQEYCNQENFYFIVNKIDINNTADIFKLVYTEIEKEFNNIKNLNENLTNSNINYFSYIDDESYEQFCMNPESDNKNIALEIIDGKSYDLLWLKYTKDLYLIDIFNEEYNSLVSKYIRDKSYFDSLYWPYINWLERCIDAELTIQWQENGNQKQFTIPNIYYDKKETMILDEMYECKQYGICSLNDTIMNFLNDSAPKLQECYKELIDKFNKSNNFKMCNELYNSNNNITILIADFINVQTWEVEIEITENNLLEGTFLNEAFSYCVNIKNANIIDELEEGIATPLEIIFQPNIPMYPMKMSSINEGSTKINVYFISEYHVDDSSGLLTTKGKNVLSWAPSGSNYDVGDYVTWMTYEGDTKDLSADSYFVKSE